MSDERLPEVWTQRDFPVLRELTRHFDESDDPVYVDAVAATLGVDREQVARSGRALVRRGLVTAPSFDDGVFVFTDVAGAAYLMTGLHPDTDGALSGLVSALQQAAEQEPDEEERSRLRRAADGLLGVSRGVMTGVLTAYLSGQVGS